MKLLLNVTSEKELVNLNEKIYGYILSIEDFSINYNSSLTKEQLKETIKYLKKNKKEVIVNINKNIHNNQIDLLKEWLMYISTLNIDYLMYYDIAILNIVNELKLNIKLVNCASTYLTNYNIVNFYENQISGVVLSNEITREDIKVIKQKTNTVIYYNVFGYIPMLVTKRKLVSNYLEHINEYKKDDIYILDEKIKHDKYPIIETNGLTVIYNENPINVIEDEVVEYIDYGIINMFNINNTVEDVLSGKVESNINFLEKKTIYKVGSKNEKA